MHYKSFFFYFLSIILAIIASFILSFRLTLGLSILAIALIFLIFLLNLKLGVFFVAGSIVFGQIARINLPFGGAVLVSDIFLFLLILAWLIKKIVKKEKFSYLYFFPFFVLFFGVALVSLFRSLNSLSFFEFLTSGLYLLRFLGIVCFFWVTADIFQRKEARQYLYFFGLMAFLLCFLGFLQFAFFPDLRFLAEYGWDPHVGRMTGTWLDPNFFGGMLVFILSLIFGLIIFWPHQKEIKEKKESLKFFGGKIFLFATAFYFVIALLLTYSRSSYLAFVVSFCLFALLRNKKWLVAGAITLLILILLFPYAQKRIEGARGLDATARMRILSWQKIYKIWQDYFWLGTGYNALPYVQKDLGIISDLSLHSRAGSDSSLLTIAATTGLFGLLSFLLFIFMILKTIWEIWRDGKQRYWLRGASLGFFAGFLGLLVHSQFVNSLLYAHLLIPLLFVLAVILKSQEENA